LQDPKSTWAKDPRFEGEHNRWLKMSLTATNQSIFKGFKLFIRSISIQIYTFKSLFQTSFSRKVGQT